MAQDDQPQPDCTCPRKCHCEFLNGELVGISDDCPEHGEETIEYGITCMKCKAEVHWWQE
ncbi:hypothetical protein COB52_01500 [Candidatus Kaiserbacteria bacterium]|nr:MAG: hypothetical protein COB52_01500 [Candidatus Kaiserbacteria bacterium]